MHFHQKGTEDSYAIKICRTNEIQLTHSLGIFIDRNTDKLAS